MLHPWPHYVIASITVSVGGLLFGLDTGIIGPVTTMLSFTDAFGPLSPTLHGLVVSSILIPAALLSTLAGSLADRIGRSYAIMCGATVFALGTALEAAAQTLGAFFAGRIITGMGEGLFLSTTVVYICEVAPAQHRGSLASLTQMFTTIGLCMGFFVCYGTTNIPSSMSWRTPFILQSVIAAALVVACPFLPQSPRWLISMGRISEVPRVLDSLGLSQADFAEETRALLSNDPSVPKLKRFLQVFDKTHWRPTSFAMFLMAMAQFSGIDGVLYYAPILFQQAGLSGSESSFFASGVSALVIVVVTIPACIFADRWKRRTSTTGGGIALGLTMFIIGALYASKSVHGNAGAARWVVIVCIYLFAVAYSITWAVVFKIYASEIQPSKTRAPASSLAQSSNWAANFIVAFTTPIFLAKSTFGAYFLFGSCSFLTAAVCSIFMPETRGEGTRFDC